MYSDQQNLALPGADAAAAALYGDALRAFNLYRGDPLALLEAALEAAPDFQMAHVLKAHLYALSTEPAATAHARIMVDALKARQLDERAASHVHALDALLKDGWQAAALALDMHNVRWPRDLLALQSGHLVDFLRGNARNLRDRIARVLPQWSSDTPGYSILLGFHAFGLEECGAYETAEETGRRAIELEPLDCWAQHAVAHVLEMQNRAQEGVAWMTSKEANWSGDDNFFKVHNWWHLALFQLELGRQDEALSLYDRAVRRDRGTLALDLIDAAAMLWRLQLAGVEVGDRWAEVANCWSQHADGRTYAFNDWHATMAYLGAGRTHDTEALLKAMRATAAGNGEAAEWTRKVGLPLAEGFIAFAHADYDTAVERLYPTRFGANLFGGSHAQRDIIDLTLTEAALRGGQLALAEALAHERLAAKPHSPANLRFLARSRQRFSDEVRMVA
ncbi:MAG TPA: tetratricopeptide repeat protein [Rhodocyclaceae bacterium]|nr:tetratricopeptide repeat protein [Rhodocyclaceae bacterium]